MEQFFSFTLVGGLLPVCCFFTPLVDVSFELCNFWLCTYSDAEAGFNYPISKKKSDTVQMTAGSNLSGAYGPGRGD
jgi:hypothetical protein